MKQISLRTCPVRAAVAAIASITLLPFIFGTAAQAEPIRGAGSTFAAPVIAEWSRAYQEVRADGGDFISPDWTVDYELVGSLAGVMRLDQTELDFAATDVPVNPAELEKHGREQFPIVFGSVAIVANIDGFENGALRLSGPVLADIYLGKIRSWSDPAIKALNPNAALPDLSISVLYRKDGSGTTFVFTDYLSAVSVDWKKAYGADTLISWPLGTGAEGTQELIRAVHAIRGAIAYAEYGQVERAGLAYASLRNKADSFVKPGPEGVRAAINAIAWEKASLFGATLTDLPGEGAYPMTAATFAVVPVEGRSVERYGRVHDLFRLAFQTGAAKASELGYVPVPPELVRQIERYWAKADIGN